MSAAVVSEPRSEAGRLDRAQEIIQSGIDGLRRLQNGLDGAQFHDAVEMVLNCQGSVIVCGIGKAGLVGQKISASLASTGTPSHFLHPAEAVHGDLGKVQSTDVVVLLSYSGETTEVTKLLDALSSNAAGTIAITKDCSTTLAKKVDITLPIGVTKEACHHGLAPTTSTTLMMALGDALTLVVSEARQFTRENFKLFHPGGNLGRSLMSVKEIMRPLHQCRLAPDTCTVGEVFVRSSLPGRRTGAIMLLDEESKLTGIFTDSDLARLLETQGPGCLDHAIAEVMTREFSTVGVSAMLLDAVQIMTSRKLSELPVLDEQGSPMGLVDITDVLDGKDTNQEDGSANSPNILPFVRDL